MQRLCSIDWCDNPHRANGFCAAHNRRNDRGADMNKVIRTVVRSKMSWDDRDHGTALYRDGCRCPVCSEASFLYWRNRREEAYVKLAKIKLERGCQDCSYNLYACALEFDHRPGEIKLFTISSSLGSKSWANIIAEVAKCDVVCGVCHAIRTQQRSGGFLITREDFEWLTTTTLI